MPSWYPASVVVRTRLTAPFGATNPPHANARDGMRTIPITTAAMTDERLTISAPPCPAGLEDVWRLRAGTNRYAIEPALGRRTSSVSNRAIAIAPNDHAS